MMRRLGMPVVLTSAVLLGACAVSPPTGPTVMALPSQGKAFDTFQQEDAYCQSVAARQSGGAQAAVNAQNNAVGSAVVGTAIGAGVGALLGAAGGNAGAGAAIGGGAGLLVGGSAGASGSAMSMRDMQARYDTTYTQCMYAYGDTVQSAPTPYPSAYPAPYPAFPGYPYAPGYFGSGFGFGGGWYDRPYRRW